MSESQSFWSIPQREGEPAYWVCMSCLSEVFYCKVPMPDCPTCQGVSTYEAFTLEAIRDGGREDLIETAGLPVEERLSFWIGGLCRHGGTVVPVNNPFTGQLLAEVSNASSADGEDAIQSTVAAAVAMAALPSHARYHALQKIAGGLYDRREEFSRLMTAEAGKPIADAKREVNRAVQTFTVAAEEARRIPGDVIPLDWTPGTDSHLGILRRFPIGPVLGITPFNFPLNLVAHKVAPALAAGNSILIKPAPQAPLTALRLGEVVLEAGLPPGALNILPCDNTLAEQLVADPRFKLLSFTGSAAVGWMLKAKSGKKKVVLELGGNAGVIVEPDADLEFAAQRCAVGGFSYAGQTCISVQRIFVHHSIADLFTTKLLLQVARLKAGDPSDDSTEIGRAHV